MPYSAGTTKFPCPTCLRLLLIVLFAALQRTRDATFAKPPITVRRSARDTLEVNKCLQVLNAGYRQTTQAGDEEGSHVLLGNFVAMYYRQEEQPLVDGCDVYTYHDATLGDLRSAFEFFSQDNNTFEGVKPNPYYLRKSEWVKAVKISARNEMRIGGVKKYRDVEISQDHFIFSRIDDTSSIARHMGFGLLLVRNGQMDYPGDTNAHEHAEHRLDCSHWDQNVLDLVRQWDLGSSRWGLLDGLWTEVTPDMGLIVARDNREVLTFHHVEALILFTQHELMVPLKQLLKAEAQGNRLSNEPSKVEQPDEVYQNDFHRPQKWRRERFIKEYFLSRKFEEFFKKLKEKNLAKGDASWADAVPPPRSKLKQAEGPKPPGRVHSRKEGSKQRGHPAKRKRDALDST